MQRRQQLSWWWFSQRQCPLCVSQSRSRRHLSLTSVTLSHQLTLVRLRSAYGSEPEPQSEVTQAMSNPSEHSPMQWSSGLTLAPADIAYVMSVVDRIDGHNLVGMNFRRLEKLLAGSGCDDATAVAQAVLAARETEELSTPAAAVTRPDLPKKKASPQAMSEWSEHATLSHLQPQPLYRPPLCKRRLMEMI